jgi:hypothetical protein
VAWNSVSGGHQLCVFEPLPYLLVVLFSYVNRRHVINS